MKMIYVVRHEIGKSVLLSKNFIVNTLVFLVIVNMVMITVENAPLDVIVVATLVCALSIVMTGYLRGWFSTSLVLKGLTMIAQEQEKILTSCEKIKSQVSAELKLYEQSPLLYYEKYTKDRINEYRDLHEQSEGDRALDIKLSRAVRDEEGKIAMLNIAKKQGVQLENDGMKELMLTHLKKTEEWIVLCKKTLADAQYYIAQISCKK